ncbi:MAG: prepilin-type N-terminal cleavage/methylation domain-containing protein [Gammaproteobacteria bacterium]|nr:prepilin-type N-terminal cleavage/methylation domain-containing protein [Gammaproteobacteria bacterium]
MNVDNIRQRGATLVELIVSIVIISVGVAGILVVMDKTTGASGGPIVQHQAVAVAEAYLEEILAKPFCDPDNAVACTSPNAPGTAGCTVCPAAEATRDLFDNVCDYNSLPDTLVRDQNGTQIAGLSSYSVVVAVSSAATLGTGGTQLTGASCQVLSVQVTVTGPDSTNVVVLGHRTNY